MQIHHGKHHQAYVDNLNKAVAGTPNEGKTIEEYATLVAQGLADPIRSCGMRGCSSYATWAGLALVWFAAALTAITGWDYFRKSLPQLKD